MRTARSWSGLRWLGRMPLLRCAIVRPDGGPRVRILRGAAITFTIDNHSGQTHPMIYSMTGYTVGSREVESGLLNVELRSVNHRYLDVQFRLPDELRSLEPTLREVFATRLNRGKIECRVSYTQTPGRKRVELDADLLAQLLDLNERVRKVFPTAQGITTADVLRWPGMLGADTLDVDAVRTVCRALLESVLEEFTVSRAREGEKLKAMLLERAAAIETQLAEVAPRMPQVMAAFQEK